MASDTRRAPFVSGSGNPTNSAQALAGNDVSCGHFPEIHSKVRRSLSRTSPPLPPRSSSARGGGRPSTFLTNARRTWAWRSETLVAALTARSIDTSTCAGTKSMALLAGAAGIRGHRGYPGHLWHPLGRVAGPECTGSELLLHQFLRHQTNRYKGRSYYGAASM
jgi:hypothetical protein